MNQYLHWKNKTPKENNKENRLLIIYSLEGKRPL